MHTLSSSPSTVATWRSYPRHSAGDLGVLLMSSAHRAIDMLQHLWDQMLDGRERSRREALTPLTTPLGFTWMTRLKLRHCFAVTPTKQQSRRPVLSSRPMMLSSVDVFLAVTLGLRCLARGDRAGLMPTLED